MSPTHQYGGMGMPMPHLDPDPLDGTEDVKLSAFERANVDIWWEGVQYGRRSLRRFTLRFVFVLGVVTGLLLGAAVARL